jgi:hypothetical protein
MRRSSSIRCLSGVIGETSCTDDNIRERSRRRVEPVARSQRRSTAKNESEDENSSKLPLAAYFNFKRVILSRLEPRIQAKSERPQTGAGSAELSTNHIGILEKHPEKLVLAVDAATEGSYEFIRYELPPKSKPGPRGSSIYL